ncbi:MAG: OmpH family outer membrane protein [Candidatus Cloacimonetes bacterium]|nr:OmpH family outer membrane protein [Candidatus Cloacimonadota bacterium]
MKKINLLLVAIILTFGVLNAQNVKLAFLDKEDVMAKCELGKKAMDEMNVILGEWEASFAAMQKVYDEKVSEFQQPLEEAPITMNKESKDEFKLTQETKKQTLYDEIRQLETEMLQFQNSIYGSQEKGGFDGLLMSKQSEILGPIFEKIKNVATKYAIKNNYSLVLESKPENYATYLDPELEITDISEAIITNMNKLVK